MGKDPRLPNV